MVPRLPPAAAPGGLRPVGPHRRARGCRARPARRAAGAPPAATRTPRRRRFACGAPRPEPAPGGGRPRLTWRGGGGAGGERAPEGETVLASPRRSAPAAAFVCAVTWAAVRDLSGSPQDMP